MEKKDGLFDGNSGNSDVNGWFGGKKHGTTLGNLYAVWYFNWWKFGGGFCSISKDEAFSFSQGIRMGGEFLVRNQMQKLQPLEPMFHHGLFGSLFLQTIPKLHSKRKLLEPQRTGEARKGHTHTAISPCFCNWHVHCQSRIGWNGQCGATFGGADSLGLFVDAYWASWWLNFWICSEKLWLEMRSFNTLQNTRNGLVSCKMLSLIPKQQSKPVRNSAWNGWRCDLRRWPGMEMYRADFGMESEASILSYVLCWVIGG